VVAIHHRLLVYADLVIRSTFGVDVPGAVYADNMCAHFL